MGDTGPDNEATNQLHQASSSSSTTTPTTPPQDTVSPSMTVHPVNSGGGVTTTFSGMPMHMYPFPPGMVNNNAPRTKRRQVKNACTNCQKACKKCDDARPCLRCVKYGIAEECIDSQRKERQKGIKRGPYKKRDGKSSTVDQQLDVSVQPTSSHLSAATSAASAGAPQVVPYAMPFPGFMQYPTAMSGKPGEAPFLMPQIVFAPLPSGPMQDGENPTAAYPHTQLYPIALAGYPGYPHPVMLPPQVRPDQQMMMMAAPPYGYQAAPSYVKSPTREMPNNDVGTSSSAMEQASTSRRDNRIDHGRVNEGMSSSHASGSGSRD